MPCGPEDDFDWCTEARDPDAIPATGSLSIDYQGFFATGPVSIKPYIENDPGEVLIAKGCGTDAKGTLWRFFGGWLVPQGTVLPAELQSDDAAGAVFNAEILVCKDADCAGENKSRIVAMTSPGSGTVHSFEPGAGIFASDARLSNGLDEEIRIEADLHWVPAAR